MTFSIEYLDEDNWIEEIYNWPDEGGGGRIYIAGKNNRLGNSRRAKITARSERYNATLEFVVYQEGIISYISPTKADVPLS